MYNVENNNYERGVHMNLKQIQVKRWMKQYFTKGILKELLIYGGIIFFCVYINPNYVAARTDVDGFSMEGTLNDKDTLFMEKISYHFRNPERFDIVIFMPDIEDKDLLYIKRIIGLPGETIQIIAGEVYIDGKQLQSDVYGSAKIDVSGVATEPFLIPDGEYFVMGDNRVGGKSYDSRYKAIGTINKDQIVGRAAVRIFPFESIRLFN